MFPPLRLCHNDLIEVPEILLLFGFFLGIYANKNLRLDNIQVYGFDYDYTLAHYSANLQTLIYDLAKEYLVNEVSHC